MEPHVEPAIAVVIPTLNEERSIAATLDAVERLPGRFDIIVVDGGSSDGTVEIVRGRCYRLVEAERGRGSQLSRGAAAAESEILWFLHADTIPPANAADLIHAALADPRVVGGHFRVRFDGGGVAGRVFALIYSCVRRWLGLCYGDSAFFVRRRTYEQVDGFRPLPLFEDLDLRRRLLRKGKFVEVAGIVTTSARRFERRSAILTFARWAVLQVLYWLGVPPHLLARGYTAIRGSR